MNSSEIQSHKTIMCPTLSQFSCIAFLGTPFLSADSGVVHTTVSAHGEEKRSTAVTMEMVLWHLVRRESLYKASKCKPREWLM